MSTFVSLDVVASAFATAALEHHEERVGTGQLGGLAGERVLDDPETRAVLEQDVAKRFELLVREPAVVRDDQRLRRPEFGGELRDDSFLVGSQHVIPPK